MTPAESSRKRSYQRHGLGVLRKALQAVQDLDAWLASLGEEAAPLRALRAEMIRQQGGEGTITSLEGLAIDSTLRTHVYLALVDHFVLAEQGTPVNRRDRKCFRVALERGALYDSLMKAGTILNDLRKNRPKKEPLSLQEYLTTKKPPLPGKSVPPMPDPSFTGERPSEAANGLSKADPVHPEDLTGTHEAADPDGEGGTS